MEFIRNNQHLADLIKAVVLADTDTDNNRRLAVLRRVSDLERCGWHPGILGEALNNQGITLHQQDGMLRVRGTGATLLDALADVMAEYLKLFGYETKPDLYTMDEAAEYLGISRSMMETYVTRRGAIQGVKIGRSWVFTQEQLDHFQQHVRRSPGRPSREESGAS